MILLIKFAEERNEKPDTIRKYINRRKDEFEGHIRIIGKQMELDEVAVKLLEEKYPLPKPIEIVQGVNPDDYMEVLEQLNKAKDLVIQLQKELQTKTEQIAAAEAVKVLLEDREGQLREMKEKQTEMDAELKRLRSRNLWERIWNKEGAES